MTGPVIAALIAAGFLAVADWISVARADRLFEGIAKPAVIFSLFVAVLLAGPGASPVRWLLIVALAASLAGDWLLLPPGLFVAGLVAFLVAHLAYLALFLLGDLHAVPAALGAAGAVVLLVTAGRAILAGAATARLGRPVIAYFGAICAMAIAATASGNALAATGAWLFVASDTILGWDRFAAPPATSPEAAARRRVAVIVPYHVAQVLLVVAVLGSTR
ncbi:MAG: lysoplasmalogenase [Chloroflexota bacterium]|nr:MAG: lysoplasmalogenase [Chloroflexota bacterium]